jgi:hypothetical protein
MYLTRKDLGGTIVAALVVLVYSANVEGCWLGSACLRSEESPRGGGASLCGSRCCMG